MMKMVTTTPNELKQQIGEAIAKAMEMLDVRFTSVNTPSGRLHKR